MTALSSLLVQDQILSVTQVEQTLQRQVILGGDLATNLLELGILEEPVIAEYLSRELDIPVLPAQYYEGIEPTVVKMMPWNVASEHRVVPVKIQDNVLYVAVGGPVKSGALQNLEFLLGVQIKVCLVLEFRLAMMLNRYFGISMTGRMGALQQRLAPTYPVDESPLVPNPSSHKGLLVGTPVQDSAEPNGSESQLLPEARPTTPPQSTMRPEDAPVVNIESNGVLKHREESTTKIFVAGQNGSRALVSSGTNERPDTTLQGIQTLNKSNLVSYSDAASILEQASSRDEILDVFFKFASQAFEFTFLAVVHGESASGKTSMQRGQEPKSVENIIIPLTQGGIFENVFRTKGFHLGPVGQHEVDLGVLAALERDIPTNCAVITVSLRQRVILLLYGDSGMKGVRANRVTRLAEFGRLVGDSFERVLLSKKYAQYASEKTDAKTPEESLKIKTSAVAPKAKRDFSAWTSSSQVSSSLEKSPVEIRSSEQRESTPVASGPVIKPSVNSIVPVSIDPPPSDDIIIEDDDRTADPIPLIDAADTAKKTTSSATSQMSETSSLRSTREMLIPSRRMKPAPAPVQSESSVSSQEVEDRVTAPPKSDVSVTAIEPTHVNAGRYSQHIEKEPQKEVRPEPEPVDGRRDTADLIKRVESITVKSLPSPEVTTIPRSKNIVQPIEVIPSKDGIGPVGYEGGRETLPGAGIEHRELMQEEDLDVTTATTVPDEASMERPTNVGMPPAYAASPVPLEVKSSVRSVQVYMPEEIDHLVERILSRRFDEAAANLLVEIGEDALSRLIKNFPGPLNCDRYQEMGRLPKVKYHGSLLKALVMFGEKAIPYVLPLLDSYDSEVRFYSTFLFSEIGSPEVLPELSKRVFDNDRQIRAVSVDVIRKFSGSEEYRWAVRDIASVLVRTSSPLEKKRLAAETLGELKDAIAIVPLAQMLGSVDGVLAERSQQALVRITFNDFGFSERRWVAWYNANKSAHRIEWAFDALNHRIEEIRRFAIDELKRFVGDAIHWPPPPYDHKQRREIRRRCVQWWEKEGRLLYPVIPLD